MNVTTTQRQIMSNSNFLQNLTWQLKLYFIIIRRFIVNRVRHGDGFENRFFLCTQICINLNKKKKKIFRSAPLSIVISMRRKVGHLVLLMKESRFATLMCIFTWFPARRTAPGAGLGRYGIVAPFGGDCKHKIKKLLTSTQDLTDPISLGWLGSGAKTSRTNQGFSYLRHLQSHLVILS